MIVEGLMEDKRGAHRNRTFLKAELDVSGGLSSLGCIVKDLSDTGARLVLSDGVVLPETFRLRLPKPDRWVHVSVRWRRGEFVGVHFDDAPPASSSDESVNEAERVRHLETEVARLRNLLEAVRADPTRLHQLLDPAAA
jgi:hypothetical protein